MPNWQNIICGTATVLSNMLPLLLPAKTEESPLTASTSAYHLGDVMWYLATNSEIGAYNVGSTELALNYSKSFTDANGANETLNVYQPLPTRTGYFATEDLQTFKDGEMCVAPVSGSTSGTDAGSGARTITASISALSFETAWHIGGEKEGLLVSPGKRQDSTGLWSYYLSVSPDFVQPGQLILIYSADAVVADGAGNRVQGHGAVVPGTSTWEIPFPPGTNLEPNILDMSLQCVVETDFYMQLTAERRSRLFTQHPFEHRR